VGSYVIGNVRDFDDSVEMAEYSARFAGTLEAFGGEVVVRGGDIDVREGNWDGRWLLVIRFPSGEAARDWYKSPEYQAVLPLRQGHCDLDMVIVEGL
jgi:uncharacterized protein (DUF1330 family)